ncbi:MAG: hypothetical protein K5867_10130 [Bacteroidales bacterium]|nr:hypothetical protein [Bacteroidales bacterium]
MPSQSTYKSAYSSPCKRPENTPVFHSDSTGKEKDAETGYHYFGARYYNSDLSIWLSVDPMSDKYPSLSPYNYCAWNPLKLVDPNGCDIDPSCIDEWNARKNEIQTRKNELVKIKNNLSNITSLWEQIHSGSVIHDLDERINSLDETLSMMSNLEKDNSTIYTLSRVGKNGFVKLILDGEKKGMVSLNYSGITSFVHEVTHCGQYYNNDIGFFTKNGAIAAYDVYDEVRAYKAALAYSPYAYDNKYMTMNQVTSDWIRQRSDYYSVSNGCGNYPVNIKSSSETIMKAGYNNMGEYPTYLSMPSHLIKYRQ